MTYIHRCESPLGPITLAGDGEALTGLWFDGQAHFGPGAGKAYAEGDLPVFDAALRWLEAYFSGRVPDVDVPVQLTGTPFRRRVWEALRSIPYGKTTTYGDLAKALGATSARAVGSAVARNPVSLIVPCHRVIGAGGRLTGYAGGLARKRALLELEGILIPTTKVAIE